MGNWPSFQGRLAPTDGGLTFSSYIEGHPGRLLLWSRSPQVRGRANLKYPIHLLRYLEGRRGAATWQ